MRTTFGRRCGSQPDAIHSLSAGRTISFELHRFARRLAKTADRIEFTCLCVSRRVTDCSFSSSCSPPGGIAPAQLLSVTGPKVMARSGTFTLRFKCALRRTSADISVRHRAQSCESKPKQADKNVPCHQDLTPENTRKTGPSLCLVWTCDARSSPSSVCRTCLISRATFSRSAIPFALTGVNATPHQKKMLRLWIESGTAYPGTYAAEQKCWQSFWCKPPAP